VHIALSEFPPLKLWNRLFPFPSSLNILAHTLLSRLWYVLKRHGVVYSLIFAVSQLQPRTLAILLEMRAPSLKREMYACLHYNASASKLIVKPA
jgi:hypothetical protein